MRAVSFEGYYTFLLYEDLDFVIPYTMGRRGRSAGPCNRA